MRGQGWSASLPPRAWAPRAGVLLEAPVPAAGLQGSYLEGTAASLGRQRIAKWVGDEGDNALRFLRLIYEVSGLGLGRTCRPLEAEVGSSERHVHLRLHGPALGATACEGALTSSNQLADLQAGLGALHGCSPRLPGWAMVRLPVLDQNDPRPLWAPW